MQNLPTYSETPDARQQEINAPDHEALGPPAQAGRPVVRSRRRRKVARLTAIALVGLFAVAACSGGEGDGDSPARRSEKAADRAHPLVSQEKARQILARHTTINNKANASRDAEGARSIQAGPLLEQTLAQYRMLPALSEKQQKGYGTPFVWEDVEFSIPARGDWFLVSASARDKGDTEKRPAVLIFERQDDGSWKMPVAVYLHEDSEPLPEPALDEAGLPTVVDAAARRGPTRLDHLDEAITDLYATGGTGDGGELKDSPSKQRMLATHQERNKNFTCANADLEPRKTRYPEIYALQTRDGGVLALVSAEFRRTEATGGASCWIETSPQVEALTGRKRVDQADIDYLQQSAVHVEKTGAATVAGTYGEIVHAAVA
jgi:hypothetical protein